MTAMDGNISGEWMAGPLSLQGFRLRTYLRPALNDGVFLLRRRQFLGIRKHEARTQVTPGKFEAHYKRAAYRVFAVPF
ncbi:hypothetical protein F6X40_09885 [Paraburkholderia sp. UCT31]|uniref:hypothetical protein n=1 Tax=Paraburkholderia sp. UCT31 TaxID=2615209 RepID=UPI001655A91B|nr:hypothetical protein [Paraburkholderia sp. UCT31]MBC8737118.1 hypothetical protein [Paraburkholderia sp. UCT31]